MNNLFINRKVARVIHSAIMVLLMKIWSLYDNNNNNNHHHNNSSNNKINPFKDNNRLREPLNKMNKFLNQNKATRQKMRKVLMIGKKINLALATKQIILISSIIPWQRNNTFHLNHIPLSNSYPITLSHIIIIVIKIMHVIISNILRLYNNNNNNSSQNLQTPTLNWQ